MASRPHPGAAPRPVWRARFGRGFQRRRTRRIAVPSIYLNNEGKHPRRRRSSAKASPLFRTVVQLGRSRGLISKRPCSSRFAADSLVEGAVSSEPVSEVQKLGADSGRVMDDSGIVKRCFPHEFGRKLYPPPRGVTPPSGYKSL